MKKIRGIFIFLATLAIFGISTESFAKNRAVFSSQQVANEPYLEHDDLLPYLWEFMAVGGNRFGGKAYRYDATIEDALAELKILRTEIAKYRRIFGTGDQTGKGLPGVGTYVEPYTSERKKTPKVQEAADLFIDAYDEIGRLKKEYLALGGSESDGIGSYYQDTPSLSYLSKIKKESKEPGSYNGLHSGRGYRNIIRTLKLKDNTPTLSEAQALVELQKKFQNQSPPTLIIGLSVGIGGALLMFGGLGLGYGFYRRRQKS